MDTGIEGRSGGAAGTPVPVPRSLRRAASPRPARAGRREARRRRKRQLYGLTGIGVVAAVIAGTVAAYAQVFTPAVPATVLTGRAGLLMTPGASVTLYGADIGSVTSVTPDGDQARIGISVAPGQVSNIPSNVQASIQAPTVFGPKYLSLEVPAAETARRLQSGQIIEPTQTPTEIDTVFGNLVTVLGSLHPAKLDATLGAISTALQGQGTQLGQFMVQLNDYLKELNPSLPALSNDLKTASPVFQTFTTAAPDLIATLGNLRTTSKTLVTQQAQFDALLLDLTGFSGTARNFLGANGTSLERTLSTLAPVTGLLSYYSPEFPCLTASADEENSFNDGKDHHMAMNATFSPSMKPYTYPQDLPEVQATGKPSCYGGPLTPATARNYPLYTFNGTGASGEVTGSQSLKLGDPPLTQQLLGSEGAAVANSAARKGK